MPTLCEVANASLPKEVHFDGVSLTPLFQKEPVLKRDLPLFWFYYNARGYAHFALRDGDYMLLAQRTQEQYRAGTPYSPLRYDAIGACETRSHELYNLRTDPMEVMNLAKDNSDQLKKMREQLDNILLGVQKETISWK